VLVAIGLGSLAVGLGYTAYVVRPYTSPVSQVGNLQGQWMQQTFPQANAPITLDQAKSIAQQYLASTQNPNLAMKEIMEFQNNFYVIYYEKDTGIGAFEMLIWKEAPQSGIGGMGNGMMGNRFSTGAMTPEPGPNMMWNTKYSPMASGMMGYANQVSSTMPVSENRAEQLAQGFLDANFQGAKTEMATQFYGYFTFDFTVNGKIAGMLSVNGYTGQVWYHSWHGAFVQEIEFD
jgi:hypothetical protein